MSWRIAESLKTLRKQIDALFPNRSKVSDGAIGDAEHASRSSDHNPWVKDARGQGVVTAIDITHDPTKGVDCDWLARVLVASRDKRIKYIIWNRQICSSKNSPWKWRPYSGPNAHTKHLHISVDPTPDLYDNIRDWNLDIAVIQPQIENLLEMGDSGPKVTELQQRLAALGFLKPADVDGFFGKQTRAAVINFQKLNKIAADGIVGKDTRAILFKPVEQPPAVSQPAVTSAGNLQTTTTANSAAAQSNLSLGGYLQTAQEQVGKVQETVGEATKTFDQIKVTVDALNARKDPAKSLWTVISQIVLQPVWAIFAFLFGLPREIWLIVGITVAGFAFLYLYRQISLGKLRETARLKILEIAELLK